MRSAAIVISVLGLALFGCDSGPVACPAITEPAVEVEVTDATTGRYIAREAEAVITDGSYRDTLRHGKTTQLEPTLIVKTLEGGFERAGTYEVSVSRPSYQSQTRSTVEVPPGECGPKT